MPGRDQRAEGEDEDHERDRQRGDLRLLEVVAECASLIALLALASPNSPTSRPGWARCTAAVAASAGADAVLRGVGVARDLEGDQRRAAVLARAGPSLPFLQRRLDRRDRRNTGQAGDKLVDGGAELVPGRPPLRLWMSTCSPARSLGNSRASTCSAACESPMPMSSPFNVTRPAADPIANATSTNANQPSTAVLR